MVVPVREAGAPCGRSIYPEKRQNRQMLDLEVVERAPFVLAMEEQIRRRRHLEDLAQQTAKYGQHSADECYLQKKEQKKGGIVLLIV